MTRQCEHCGASFEKDEWFVRRGLGRFCSRKCFGAAHQKEQHPNWKGGIVTPQCERCGASFAVNASELRRGRGRFCSRECATGAGPTHASWGGGRRIDHDGYVRVWPSDALEHILVVERALGKSLPPGAVIHHVNGVKHDNRTSNLVICQDHRYHMDLHRRARVRAKGGRPFGDRLCWRCDRTRPASDFTKSQSMCRSCHREYEAKRRAARRVAA